MKRRRDEKCQLCGEVFKKLKQLKWSRANIRACTLCRFEFYGKHLIDQQEIIREIKKINDPKIIKGGDNNVTYSTITTTEQAFRLPIGTGQIYENKWGDNDQQK